VRSRSGKNSERGALALLSAGMPSWGSRRQAHPMSLTVRPAGLPGEPSQAVGPGVRTRLVRSGCQGWLNLGDGRAAPGGCHSAGRSPPAVRERCSDAAAPSLRSSLSPHRWRAAPVARYSGRPSGTGRVCDQSRRQARGSPYVLRQRPTRASPSPSTGEPAIPLRPGRPHSDAARPRTGRSGRRAARVPAKGGELATARDRRVSILAQATFGRSHGRPASGRDTATQSGASRGA